MGQHSANNSSTSQQTNNKQNFFRQVETVTGRQRR